MEPEFAAAFERRCVDLRLRLKYEFPYAATGAHVYEVRPRKDKTRRRSDFR
jgi:hypothetical protein